MIHQVEILRLDLRYESYRLKSLEAERRLLNSIIEHGIKDPLQGVDDKGSLILLNGFKRVRCCRKLKLKMVPYQSLGND